MRILQPMSAFQEQIYFRTLSMISSGILWMGAIMSVGEVRWLYITTATSVLTACFLSLTFRRPNETIKPVVGRAGLSILGGVFFTKLATHYLGLTEHTSDGIYLAAFSASMCIVVFFVGVKLLDALGKKSDILVNRIIDKLIPDDTKDKDL